jgi:hypothetical protein
LKLRAKIIACETVGEELRNLIPEGIPCTFLEFGLHCTPEKLNAALQKEIDETRDGVDTILLGYGMCSKGALGLEARNFKLVIPRVDDCIALFLGSKDEYTKQHLKAPGTFYLTKGWIECGDDPYTEYVKLRGKYGDEKAYWLEKKVIENYTRLALINTGNYNLGRYREYAKMVARFFSLTFEEIPGSNVLIRKLIEGDWDESFVIVEPGGKVRYDMFLDNFGVT